jgi:hypothetical protein
MADPFSAFAAASPKTLGDIFRREDAEHDVLN